MTDKTENGGPMHVDTDLVRQLAELLDATNLTEIEVEDGERKIRVARKISAAAAPVYAPAPVAVMQSSWTSPALRSSRMTTGTPPAS